MNKCRIGRFCSIASGVQVVYGDHPTSTFVSTHLAFYSCSRPGGRCFARSNKFDEIRYADKTNKILVEIGNDVWIESNVLIIGGVHIGDGAVIASEAVVKKDVPSYAIVGGTS